MRAWLRERWIFVAALGTWIVAVGCAAAVWIWVDPKEGELWTKVFEALVTLSLVVVVGFFFSLALSSRENALEERIRLGAEERDEWRRGREFLLRFHREVIEAYNEVKHARRTLQMGGWDQKWSGVPLSMEDAQRYHTCMEAINVAQLTFERLKRECEQHGKPFGSRQRVVYDALKLAESGLNRGVLSDWEDFGSQIHSGAIAGPTMRRLAVFLDSTSFQSVLSERVDQVEREVQHLLLAGPSKD